MRFEFATATRIIFGPGSSKETGSLAAQMGRRALVITGKSVIRARPLLESLAANNVDVVTFSVSGEPTTDVVCEGANLALDAHCDLVVGFGGGSVLDSGKAVAALLTNGCDPYKYLEVIGQGKVLTEASAPYIAVPTTAGTGAEVTRNAVLFAARQRIKVSLRSPLMLPRLAIVDPELTYALPAALTASTGLDALTQVMEPFVSPMSNPVTDAFCREGLARAARSLRRAYEENDNTTAREDMSLAGLLGGLALANSKLGAVHGFAGLLGGMFPAPHGTICARLLPLVMDANIRALQSRHPGSEALNRYDEVAQILTGDRAATAREGVDWVEALVADLSIPSLSDYGVGKNDFAELIHTVPQTSSMKGNPVELLPDELEEILVRAL